MFNKKQKKFMCGASITGLLILSNFSFILAQNFQFVWNSGKVDVENYANYTAHIMLADSLIAEQKLFEAAEEYTKIVERYPNMIACWEKLAAIYLQNEKIDEAIKCYQKIIELDPVDIETMKILAQLLISNDNQKEAIELYEKILMFEADNVDIHKKLVRLYNKNNMPKKVIKQYEEIIKLNPNDVETKRKLAFNYFSEKQFMRGIKLLEQIVTIQPDSSQIRKELAQQYVWHDMPKRAITHYEKIVQINPDDFEYKKKLANQYMRNNQPDAAAPIYRDIIRNDPQDCYIKMQLAKSYLVTEEYDKAAVTLKELVDYQPSNFEASLLLADLECKSAKWDLAKNRLSEVLRFEPDNKTAKKLMKQIRLRYGPSVQLKYKRTSDSNQIIKETKPVVLNYFQNRNWEYKISAAEHIVKDGKFNSKVNGYGGSVLAKYNFTHKISSLIQIGSVAYSTGWSPFSLKFQLNQSLLNRFYLKAWYHQFEYRESVSALESRVNVNRLAGSIYWQTTKRVYFLSNYEYDEFSDQNKQIKIMAEANFDLRLNNPTIGFKGTYSHIDFKNIYLNSTPYWTPDQLNTYTLGTRIGHHFRNWFDVEVGYAMARQQKNYAHNVHVNLGIHFTPFSKLFLQYIEDGSSLYHTEGFQVYFQHRF